MSSQNANKNLLTILIVENDENIRSELLAFVKKNFPQAQIIEARNANEAIRKIHDTPPEVVSLDYGIPDGKGGRVINEIESTGVPTRVFFLTRTWKYGEELAPYSGRYIIMNKWRPARRGETRSVFEEEYIKVIEGKVSRDEKYIFVNLPPEPQTPPPSQPPIDRAGEELFGKRRWPYFILLIFLLGVVVTVGSISYELGKDLGTAREQEFEVLKQEVEFQRCKAKFLSLVVNYYSASQSGDAARCRKCATELRNLSDELEKKGVLEVITNGASDDLRVRFLKNGSVWVLPRATVPDSK